MKHAGPQDLERLDLLLTGLRALPGMNEKKPGIFYRKSRAFLHFHRDPSSLFADLRAIDGVDFDRFEVTDQASWPDFIVEVARRL